MESLLGSDTSMGCFQMELLAAQKQGPQLNGGYPLTVETCPYWYLVVHSHTATRRRKISCILAFISSYCNHLPIFHIKHPLGLPNSPYPHKAYCLLGFCFKQTSMRPVCY